MLTTSLLVTQTFSHSYHIFLVTQTLSHSDPILFSHSPFPWLISHLFLFHSQPQGKHGRYGRRRGLPVDDALRWRPANLLPVTKFIARALFTKCLGQVDLPPAPRNTACLMPSASAALHSQTASLVAGIPWGWRKRRKIKDKKEERHKRRKTKKIKK
mgnify:CR=1 FL=1